MKKLFIYFSLSGNGDYIANYLETKGYEIRKISKKKQKEGKPGFWTIFFGGMLAGFNHKSKIQDFDLNVEDYDEIAVGSPIWNARISCPMNTALSRLNLKDKKLHFIFYSGSGTASKASERVMKEYPNARITILKEPKSHQDEIIKIEF